MTPRKAKVNITYTPKKKKAVRTASVMAEYEEGFTYTDAATGQSDTVSLTLCNRDLRWANKWLPKKGDKLTAKIKTYSWDKDNKEKVFSCGKFCCDDLSLSGPTLICKIGGVSVPEGQAFRATERTKTWKNVTINEIAATIGKTYGLAVKYDAPVIKIATIEQSGKTDADFLNSLCQDYGLYIKIYFGKLIIYSVEKYEAKKPVATYNIKDFESWDYNTTLTGTYTGATIKYSDGAKGKEHSLTIGEAGRMLNINEKVDNLADAKLKATARLNKENRSAVTMSATIRANLKIVAGVCIKVTGAYKLNGKYFVDKVTHKIEAEGAYTMDLEMHLVPPKKKKDEGEAKGDDLKVGDHVSASGDAYSTANGGKHVSCNGTYYVTQILGDSYKYPIGIAKRKGGARYGWVARDNVTKV